MTGGADKPEKNRNPDVNEHLGFLRNWTIKMKKKGYFSLWDKDELFNQAYLCAYDLLSRNYNPKKGTITTFLNSFLWSRVAYAYGKYHGWRHRKEGWVILETALNLDTHDIGKELHAKPELPPDLTEAELDVVLMRVGGMSYKKIAIAHGYKSPNTVTHWIEHYIKPKFRRAGLL